jgi:peroxiredoxin
VELQGQIAALRQKGLGLAAISYDSPEILGAFSKQRGITFPLLSDAGSATIRRYGILNPLPELVLGAGRDDPVILADVQKYVSGRPNAGQIGMAFPGTFILDRQGRVTSRHFEDYYVERSTASAIMLRLGNTATTVAGTKISTGQLDLATYPSDATISPGNRFSLALEIRPRTGMHIYAPGASDYRVISLTLTPQPFVRTLPMRYPASEVYFFRPLNERVPVYQKPFTLVQEITLEASPQAQAALRGRDSLTLSGVLEYQACDDTICYSPASLPLSWTVRLQPLIVERPIPPR